MKIHHLKHVETEGLAALVTEHNDTNINYLAAEFILMGHFRR